MHHFRTKTLIFLTSFSLFLIAVPVFAQSAASVGLDDGYSAKVMEKILKSISISQSLGTAREVRLLLTLDGDGKLTGCTIRNSSAIKSVDEDLCRKIRSLSPFGSPPYGQPAEVSVAFYKGEQKVTSPIPRQAAQVAAVAPAATASAEHKPSSQNKSLAQDSYPQKYQAYLRKIVWQLRNSMYVPQESAPGTYYSTARIKLNKQGKILESSIINSSGDKIMDKYVLQGLKRAGHVPPPPEGLGENLDLTFQMVR